MNNHGNHRKTGSGLGWNIAIKPNKTANITLRIIMNQPSSAGLHVYLTTSNCFMYLLKRPIVI